MNKKMLVLDIDGTLVNSKKEISARTLKYLHKIQQEGHIVVLASGRPLPGMLKFVEQLKLKEYDGYVLAYNGARIIKCNTGKEIFSQGIPNEYVKTVFDFAIKNKIGMVTYDDDKVITGTRVDEYMLYEARLNKMMLYSVKNFINYVNYDPVKFLLTANVNIAPELEKQLSELMANKAKVYRSEPYFIEVTNENVDKALSIDKLIEIIGMSKKDVICCGDGYNDLSMIKYAGIGVAMENAKDEVKEAADYITLSNDNDGIVKVIKEFIA